MNFCKLFVLIFFLVIPPAIAQEEAPPAPAEKNGFLDSFMDVLGGAAKEALQEQVDEVAGTYKGKLNQIKLLDRRGDRIVLEVTYKDVKRSDGVTVQGQVLSGGVPLDGFSNQLTPVSGREGRVRLTISQGSQGSQGSQDSGWGQASDWGVEGEAIAMESDQIQLYLVRDTKPDRPFGHLVYDLAKSWTGKNEPDVPPTAGDGAIELAEDETLEGGPQTIKPYIPVGVVLAPSKTVIPSPKALPATKKTASKSTTHTMASVAAATTTYDFYKAAPKAVWRDSVYGKLIFSAKRVPTSGFASRRASGKLSTGNAAKDILLTYPSPQKKSWIEGRFPAMTLGKNVHFKAVAGFGTGAIKSDGARFRVIVVDGSRKTSIIRESIRANRYVNLDGDLSAWAGKKISIILRVDSGRTAIHDYAVWVKPRLITK
jgi:hypothetical protein